MDVGVLGAGDLGQGIAAVCAMAGHQVKLHAAEATDVMDGIDAIERHVAEVDVVSWDDPGGAPERLDGTTDLDGAVSAAAVVIETRSLSAQALREAFATVEELAESEALLTTARESGRVTSAAAGLQHPERALGLYFYAPRSVDLVEVVAADQTSASAADRAVSFVNSLGYRPVVVRDVPGAITRRLTLVQEVEAMRLVNDGVAGVDAVDTAMSAAVDQPVGPLERADRAGLDGRLAALETLVETAGDRFDPPPVLRDLVTAGNTGMQAGRGFYEWENGSPTGAALPEPEIPHSPQDGPDQDR